jgi:molybdopterin/thiamine biosynthesis adenylyltransferase
MKLDDISQFSSNMGILSERDFMTLSKSKVIIVGLGGLGGNTANNLVRLGVSEILLIDFDRFSLTNLNRQLFSNHANLDSYKVNVIQSELLKINPSCKIEVLIDRIEDVSVDVLSNYDYLIDAVDSPQTKIYLSVLSTLLNIPLLHGACAGWFGQVGWILPGCELLNNMYMSSKNGIEKEMLNPSFIPSIVSGIMVSEFIKFIQKDKNTIINQLILIDALSNSIIKTGDNNG